jgi:flagellar protein FliS
MYSDGIKAYRTTNVITADPKKLVIMCYEGAIENLKIGKERLLQQDYDGKNKSFIKVQDIINELLCSLDFEKGGQVAKNLESLYNYMLRRIVDGDIKKDTGAIEEVVGRCIRCRTKRLSQAQKVLMNTGVNRR